MWKIICASRVFLWFISSSSGLKELFTKRLQFFVPVIALNVFREFLLIFQLEYDAVKYERYNSIENRLVPVSRIYTFFLCMALIWADSTKALCPCMRNVASFSEDTWKCIQQGLQSQWRVSPSTTLSSRLFSGLRQEQSSGSSRLAVLQIVIGKDVESALTVWQSALTLKFLAIVANVRFSQFFVYIIPYF